MRKPISWLGAAMGILILTVTVAKAGEQKVPLEQVPKPVMKAVKARFTDADVSGATKEKNDEGELVYEVSLYSDGQAIDVVLAPDGKISLIEKTIAAKSLPSAVIKTLEAKYPNADYKRFEEIITIEANKERLAYYEALLVTADKSELEVELTTDGNIVKESKVVD
ncbi:MAG: PepSY-like domain-containing protein [Gammaproteobacteria bacterium]